MSKAWKSSEQVKSKSGTSPEQFITSSRKVVNKSLTWAEKVLKKLWVNTAEMKKQIQAYLENIWSCHE